MYNSAIIQKSVWRACILTNGLFYLVGHVGKDRQNFTALSTVPEGIRSKTC